MPHPEHHQPHRRPGAGELPADLADFLREPTFACVPELTDRGAILVAKAPGVLIDEMPVRVPILLTSQLYRHPAAPVVRLVTAIYDRPYDPLKLESFLNVQNERQRQILEALAQQDDLPLVFYDEVLSPRRTKIVRIEPAVYAELYEQALVFLDEIPPRQFDFDHAKATVIARVPLWHL
jgi:hypothetical protein